MESPTVTMWKVPQDVDQFTKPLRKVTKAKKGPPPG